jgi:hypothetical protein
MVKKEADCMGSCSSCSGGCGSGGSHFGGYDDAGDAGEGKYDPKKVKRLTNHDLERTYW